MAGITQISIPATLPTRIDTTILPPSENVPSFLINRSNKSYKHQYANIYFVRLRILRDFVEDRAAKRWKGVAGNPILVPRVLEVVKSQLCYIVGTVYMDMPLKPNVMEDIARDRSIPAPPPPPKFYSPDDNVMLEDESGRIKLVGERVKSAKLVTGVILGALGIETPNGEFEVVDLCYAGMAPQVPSSLEEDLERMEVDEDISISNATTQASSDEWIAVVSGLDIGSQSSPDAQIQMLVEYLTGEEGGIDEQISAAQISRLIIAGNSLAPVIVNTKGENGINGEDKKPRRYGYDSTSFSAHPILTLSAHLLDIGRVMPIHILPGETDPSGTILPQQPFPRAMFGSVSSFPTFTCETNPTHIRIGCGSKPHDTSTSGSHPTLSRTLLVNSGQPLNDMFKYLPTPPITRLSILESTLRWRHMAPTAPDTLWCHPYFASDPFLITETPDLYIVGGQPRFGTRLVVDGNSEDEPKGVEDGKSDYGKNRRCRLILVPRFSETGVLVLVNMRTLDVKTVRFAVEGMSGDLQNGIKDDPSVLSPSELTKESTLSAPESSVSFGQSSLDS